MVPKCLYDMYGVFKHILNDFDIFRFLHTRTRHQKIEDTSTNFHQKSSKISKIIKNHQKSSKSLKTWLGAGQFSASCRTPTRSPRVCVIFIKCLGTFEIISIFLAFCIPAHDVKSLMTLQRIFIKITKNIKNHQNH